MKKIVYTITSLLMLSSTVVPAFAQTTTPSDSESSFKDRMQAKISQAAENRSDSLQARATREIANRITRLQALMTRLDEIKKLTADQKAQFKSQIEAEIASLQSLQTKIQGDNDVTTLQTDVQSIVKDFRVYALFIPKIYIVVAADRILATADNMSIVAEALQTRINEAKTSGKDVASLETALSDMQAKIADAKTQAQNAINTVTPLTPDGFPGNKSTLQSARAMLVTARHDLTTARQDARIIIQGLHAFNKGTPQDINNLKPTTSTTSAGQ